MGLEVSHLNNNNPPKQCLTESEKQEFWKRFKVKMNKRFNDTTTENAWEAIAERTQSLETQQKIEDSLELQQNLEMYADYFENLQNKNLNELVNEIQPKWDNRQSKFLSESTLRVMTVGMIEYRLRGLDIDKLNK